MQQRSRGGWIPLALLFLWPSIRPGAVLEGRLIGRLSDSQGDAVSGAMVYVRGVLDACPQQTETLRSGLDGSFSTSLPPGRYIVAALKPGYDVAMTEVNTLARPVFELRMKPSSGIQLGDLPVGPAGENLGTTWILRQRHGDVLRDVDPAPPVFVTHTRESEGGPSVAVAGRRESTGLTAALREAIDGEIEQRWGGGELGGSGSPQSAALGQSTALTMRGAIGAAGRWRFDGAVGRATAEADRAGEVERRADRLSAGMQYRLGPADLLEASIRYGGGRYLVGAGDRGAALTDQQARMVGVDSRWDHRFGDGAGLRVDAALFEAGVRFPEPGGSPVTPLPGDAQGPSRIIDRTITGGVGLALEEGSHSIDLGIRAGAYRYDLKRQGVLIAGLDRAPGLPERGETGRTLSLTAGDRWRAGNRAEVDYGFAYHAGVTSDDGYLVPRVGVIWMPGAETGLTVRSEVTLLVADLPAAADAHPGAGGDPRADASRLGYRIGIERRRPEGLRLAASLSVSPFEGDPVMGRAAASQSAAAEPAPFLRDGAASHHELGLELERDFGTLRGGVEGAFGRARGLVTPAAEEAPVQILSDGEVRYCRAQAWAQYAPTETEVQIDYRSVQGESYAVSSPGPVGYRQVDLVVYQDLPSLRSLPTARLRLLMAYQGLVSGSLYDTVDGAPISGSASRLTGGVRIFF